MRKSCAADDTLEEEWSMVQMLTNTVYGHTPSIAGSKHTYIDARLFVGSECVNSLLRFTLDLGIDCRGRCITPFPPTVGNEIEGFLSFR